MLTNDTATPLSNDAALDLLQRVAERIAPVWPLEDMIAVNPYLGLSDLPFADAVDRLARLGGFRSTLPLEQARERLSTGAIDASSLRDAIRKYRPDLGDDADAFVRELDDAAGPTGTRLPIRCDLVSGRGGTELSALLVDRVSSWASAWFDDGQAAWSSVARDAGFFRSWRAEAMIDRTPDVLGVHGFRSAVATLPEDHVRAAIAVLSTCDLDGSAMESYVHALALRVGGWSSVCARVDWEARRRGGDSDALVQWLTVLLCWDAAAATVCDVAGTGRRWNDDVVAAAGPGGARVPHEVVLQEALDRSEQQRLMVQLRSPRSVERPTPSALRATVVCCIDVRSEVLRRNLESVAPDVTTSGFAGFFGLPIEVLPIGHDRAIGQCPPLVAPSLLVEEGTDSGARTDEAVRTRQYLHHLHRAWKQFKTGAVSCFGFVSPLGLLFAPKLFTDAFGVTRPVRNPATEALPRWAAGSRTPVTSASADSLPLDAKVETAAGVLRAMSMVQDPPPVVALVGHGSTSVNNPQSAALECGACGGHSGDVNARVAAALLNDPEVRHGVRELGIDLPDTTLFVPALHDTTTDVVTLLDREKVPQDRLSEIEQLDRDLDRAGALTRRERAGRLGLDDTADPLPEMLRRTRDWAQVRPEWGLAGCRAFVAAPRSRTAGVDLGGQVFLHEYEPRLDLDDAVLEQIMSAPMVVASWITMQYYASTVEPTAYGCGDKTLHNVVGRMGVLEGSGGDVRIGLSRQSVHDGRDAQHEPLRLHAVIEAATDSIDRVISRQAPVSNLLDNGWIHLHAIDPDTQRWFRYVGEHEWEVAA